MAAAERLAEALERMMQPHLRCPAIGMVARAVVVEDIDRDNGPGLRRGMKSGLVGETQVAAQPDDLGFRDKSSPDCLIPTPSC